jgi:hypothetical protein
MAMPLVFLAGVELFDLVDRGWLSFRQAVAAIVVVLAIQAVSMNEFGRFTFMRWTTSRDGPSDGETMSKVIEHLRSQGVAHVFSTNALLQWQIAFYSGESMTARWKTDVERYPPYVAAVNGALEGGRPTAIVGYVGATGGLEDMVPDRRSIVEIDGKYFVYVNPDKELLQRLGFRLR